MTNFFGRIGIGTMNLLSRLPLRVLYWASDWLLYPLVHCCYRRQMVRHNLSMAFPDRPEAERRDIERKFYHWFCDLMVETLKVHSITPEEICQRFEWRNLEPLEQEALAEGRELVCCYLSHYCNWEMAVGLPFWQKAAGMCQFYHPLRNKDFDRWLADNRSQFGAVNIRMKEALRKLLELRQGIRQGLYRTPQGGTIRFYMIGSIADQLPKRENIHLRVPFLNQSTGIFTGSERLARKLDMSVYYIRIERPERGRYVATFERMDTPELQAQAKDDEFAYSRDYIRRLESQIVERPELWLWTHDRWKR